MSAVIADGFLASREVSVGARPRRRHPDAGIIFGSAAASPMRKPDSVRATCEAIGLARSTYYYQSHRSNAAIEFEQKIVLRLHELRQLRPDDGYRRMTQQLQAEGLKVNRKRIARLMQLHSLSKKPSRREDVVERPAPMRALATTVRDPARVTGPQQIWVTDVSYAHISSCLVYAAAVIDAWSGEVVGYAASLQITNRLARIALHSAVRAHRPLPGCLHHSTCGSQYFTRSFCELLRRYGLIPSGVDSNTARYPSDVTSSRQIVNVDGYATWKDVVDRPSDFIQALYSPGRVDAMVGKLRSGN
jgi:putative transposase